MRAYGFDEVLDGGSLGRLGGQREVELAGEAPPLPVHAHAHRGLVTDDGLQQLEAQRREDMHPAQTSLN